MKADQGLSTQIEAMHPDDISNDRSIRKRTFRGTRTLKRLKQRKHKNTLKQRA